MGIHVYIYIYRYMYIGLRVKGFRFRGALEEAKAITKIMFLDSLHN